MLCFRFGRQLTGSRFDAQADHVSNTPFHNPGPGNYDVHTTTRGDGLDSGKDTSAWMFGKSAKMREPSRE